MSTRNISIEIQEISGDGQEYVDTVRLNDAQWRHLLEMIQNRIEELKARPGHRSGLRGMREYDMLVSIICTIDI